MKNALKNKLFIYSNILIYAYNILENIALMIVVFCFSGDEFQKDIWNYYLGL
jgi:hypothetical protein